MSEILLLIWLWRPNDWPRKTSTGADTSGNGNSPPRPTPRDRASIGRDAGFRHIGVVHEEYAVSPDGMKAFGVLDLEPRWKDAFFPSDFATPTTRACDWR